MSKYPEKLTDGYYYVRKTFEDKESQLARYRVLGNAKTKAEENPGYCVFAEDGTCVYAPVVDEAEVEVVQTETEQAKDAQTEALPSAEEEIAMQEAVEDVIEEEEKPAFPNDGNENPIGYAKLKMLMNIRRGNALNAPIVTLCQKDTILPVLQVCDNGWLRVQCEESETGYAYVTNEGGQYAFIGREMYTVRKGDSLWKIAENKLEDGSRYTEIRICNGLDSNIIRVGMTLLIP